MNIKYHYFNNSINVIYSLLSTFSSAFFSIQILIIHIYYIHILLLRRCLFHGVHSCCGVSGCMVVHSWYSYYCRLYSDKYCYLYLYRLVCNAVSTWYLMYTSFTVWVQVLLCTCTSTSLRLMNNINK